MHGENGNFNYYIFAFHMHAIAIFMLHFKEKGIWRTVQYSTRMMVDDRFCNVQGSEWPIQTGERCQFSPMRIFLCTYKLVNSLHHHGHGIRSVRLRQSVCNQNSCSRFDFFSRSIFITLTFEGSDFNFDTATTENLKLSPSWDLCVDSLIFLPLVKLFINRFDSFSCELFELFDLFVAEFNLRFEPIYRELRTEEVLGHCQARLQVSWTRKTFTR